MRRDIPVVLTAPASASSGCAFPRPRIAPPASPNTAAPDTQFAPALAINWVEAKILNSRRVLQRLAANRDDAEITRHLLALNQLAENCRGAASIETLRGYEGTAAGRYLSAMAGFSRSTPLSSGAPRPPHNAPNAVLSYAYTLLADRGRSPAPRHRPRPRHRILP